MTEDVIGGQLVQPCVVKLVQEGCAKPDQVRWLCFYTPKEKWLATKLTVTTSERSNSQSQTSLKRRRIYQGTSHTAPCR